MVISRTSAIIRCLEIRRGMDSMGGRSLLARYFEAPTSVSFRCTWLGLQGRQLADFSLAVDWDQGHVAAADRRTTEGEWPVAMMAASWSGIVSELCSPVLNLFGLTQCSAEFVEGLAPRFVNL